MKVIAYLLSQTSLETCSSIISPHALNIPFLNDKILLAFYSFLKMHLYRTELGIYGDMKWFSSSIFF
jgi:hypothetical protein